MTYTYDEETFSDLYKDVNGFRPRGHYFYSATPSEKQDIWDDLLVELDEQIKETNARREQSVIEFETLVTDLIVMGANDRKTAIKWLMDDDQQYCDSSYFRYEYDLPYNYEL